MVITNIEINQFGRLAATQQQKINNEGKKQWHFENIFELGEGFKGEILLNIDIAIKRIKDGNQAIVNSRTTFELVLATSEVIPSTAEDFEFYTLMFQVAVAHSRVLFQSELKGTVFSKDIVPLFSNKSALAKVKLGLGMHDRDN